MARVVVGSPFVEYRGTDCDWKCACTGSRLAVFSLPSAVKVKLPKLKADIKSLNSRAFCIHTRSAWCCYSI